MPKFFHEAPNKIFKEVQSVTDGDYCLVHLMDQNPTYRNLFLDAVAAGREVILDNSIFELGEAYDQDRYMYWIRTLKPTWYIIPDVLEDKNRTVENVRRWYSNPVTRDLPGKKIGVLQGKTEREVIQAYSEIFPFVDMIAISFDYSFFENGAGENQEDKWMRGRQRLLHNMNSWVPHSMPVHLLGTALPQEGLFYKDLYPWIYSIDTSNPVVAGVMERRYSVAGLDNKNRHKLADQIDDEITAEQWFAVKYNIERFKGFWQ